MMATLQQPSQSLSLKILLTTITTRDQSIKYMSMKSLNQKIVMVIFTIITKDKRNMAMLNQKPVMDIFMIITMTRDINLKNMTK